MKSIRLGFIGIYIISVSIVCVGCSDNSIKVTKLQFSYSNSFYYKPLIGKELKGWGDTPPGINIYVDNTPNEIDCAVTLKNSTFFTVNSSKLHFEFWLAEAKNDFSTQEDFGEYVKRMQKNSKWVLVWARDIILKEVKPHESRQIKVEKLRLRDFMDQEYAIATKNDNEIVITKFKGRAICGKSINDNTILIDIQY